MPKCIYNGPYAETEVFLPEGGSLFVAKGEAKEIPDSVLAGLDASGDWTAVKTPATDPVVKTPAASTPPVEPAAEPAKSTAAGGKE